MPAWTAYGLNWFWTFFTGDVNAKDDGWKLYCDSLDTFLNECPPSSIALHILYQAKPIDAVQREQVSKILKNGKQASNVVGSAIATDSRLTRGILTVINWIVSKPFPESAFKTPDEAIAWLEASSSAASAQSMRSSLLKVVPSSAIWPGMGADVALKHQG